MKIESTQKVGFTLIELLVVIAIIAVLMGILMPALRAAKDHASRIHCTANVRTLDLAWTMYATENDNRLVGGNVGGGTSWIAAPSAQNTDVEDKLNAIRSGTLWKYVKEEKVYLCPSDRRTKSAKAVSYCSYSLVGGANGEAWAGMTQARNLTDIKRPAEKYIFVEDIDTRGYNVGSWQLGFTSRRWIDPLAVWHNKRSTLGYADGHVEMHPWHDKSFLDWADGAVEQVLSGALGTYRELAVPIDEPTDYNYMRDHYACKSHQ